MIHVPHASRHVPEDLRARLLLADDALALELLRMTDHRTDEIFRLPENEARCVVYPVSRLVVDPERFRDDAREPMAALGMGTIYTRTSYGEPLRPPPGPEEREALLARFYDPHHAALSGAVAEALRAHGRCLVIDGHSYPSEPLPYETDPFRPDICLGTDPFHTPPELVALACERFRSAGFEVARDRPFAGALVPAAYFRRDRRVAALMIELNRRLYLDEATGEPGPAFETVCERVRSVVRELVRASGRLTAGASTSPSRARLPPARPPPQAPLPNLRGAGNSPINSREKPLISLPTCGKVSLSPSSIGREEGDP